MKKLVLTLVCLSSLSLAQAGEKRDDNRFLKCARQNILTRKLDVASFEKLADAIDQYQVAPVAAQKECEALLKEVKKLPKLSKKEFENNYDRLSDQQNAKTNLVLYLLMARSAECTLGSAGADVAFGLAIGAGMGVGSCRRSDGKVFAIVAPRVSWGFGGGAIVTAGVQHFTIHNGKIVSDETSINAGFLIAQRELDGDDDAFGLGFGIMLENDYTFNLKLVPIGNNFKELREALN